MGSETNLQTPTEPAVFHRRGMDRWTLSDTALRGRRKPDSERCVLVCLLHGTATVVVSPASPKDGAG